MTFEGNQFECTSQYKVKVLVGNMPGEDAQGIEPYPLAIAPMNRASDLDRSMEQFAISGYKNLRFVNDACLVI